MAVTWKKIAYTDAASMTAKGIIEIATATETTTGTDATRAVSPDGLAGSNYGKRVVGILVSDPGGDAITAGDHKAYFRAPSVMNGWNLIAVAAHLSTASTAGGDGCVEISIYNVADGCDMLSTNLTLDQNEKDSATAAVAAVIDGTHDDLDTGDEIEINIETGKAGTGAKGLYVEMQFQEP